MPVLGVSMRCPARPIRCIPLATEGGASIWITRSTAPMSIPSSSEEVATRARTRPALSASSISVRCARASEPWWARASGSPASSFSAAARRSAMRRLLTKMSVERCSRTSSTSRGWMAVQMELRTGPCAAGPEGISMGSPRRAMSSTGTSMRSASVRRAPASTMVTGRQTGASAGAANSVRSSSSGVSPPSPDRSRPGGVCTVADTVAAGTAAPPRNRATSSRGRCVADSPIRCSLRPARCSSRSSDSARCAPRLVGTSAWISSTMTVSTLRSASRALEVNSR